MVETPVPKGTRFAALADGAGADLDVARKLIDKTNSPVPPTGRTA